MLFIGISLLSAAALTSAYLIVSQWGIRRQFSESVDRVDRAIRHACEASGQIKDVLKEHKVPRTARHRLSSASELEGLELWPKSREAESSARGRWIRSYHSDLRVIFASGGMGKSNVVASLMRSLRSEEKAVRAPHRWLVEASESLPSSISAKIERRTREEAVH